MNFIILRPLLRATRGARNPNLQVVITHASHVCSQHLFGLPPIMDGVFTTQFDPSIPSNLIARGLTIGQKKKNRSREIYVKHSLAMGKSVWISDLCRPHFLILGFH